MTKLQAEIIISLADNKMSVAEIARKLYMHRSTVVYHLRAIQKETGRNPRDFYDMCALLPIARELLKGETNDGKSV